MTFPEYESFDGLGLAALIKTGALSPAELLDAAIERIENYNPSLNAVIYKMYDEAHRALHQLGRGAFYGVPFLLKDMLADYAGAPLLYGSRFMRGHVPKQDSELVKRFKQAGLNIIGKTNLPEFGLSPVTEPALFGPTHNPWDLHKTCGGSSGGSAVAVASRMVPMAHGGDGAGSLRIPAAYCGVFGFKPSRGRVPAGPNVIQITQGLVVEHVLTRSVRDSAAMLDAITGPAELGATINLGTPAEGAFLASSQRPPRPLRIGFTERPFFLGGAVHPEYSAALLNAVKLCEGLGHQGRPLAFKLQSAEIALAYLITIAADTAACIDKLATLLPNKTSHSDLETATAILYEAGEHFSAKDFAWASYILDETRRYIAELSVEYDVFMTPTMPGPPPAIGEFKPARLQQNFLEILRRLPYGPLLTRLTRRLAADYFAFIPFTPIFNITGQPAMSVPLFWDKQGLPIGIQFAGRFGDEQTLLQLAQQLENAQSWLGRRPLV